MNMRQARVSGLATIGFALFLGSVAYGAEPVGGASDGALKAGEPQEHGQELVLTIPGPDKVQLRMRRIEAGTYVRGSRADEERRGDNEGPRHEVTISKPFYLGTFEVTQDQWGAVMGNNPSQFKGLNNPVDNASWYDCQAFISQLNKLGIGTFRLPTEAEWEYACRAGTTGPYAGKLDEMAWYKVNSDKKPHPVGQKKPNAWGLYDMHGNVWEWCADWYGPYASGNQTDPKGAAAGEIHVFRGGSWNYDAGHCRSASRYNSKPSNRYYPVGFRLVRALP